MKIKIYFCGSIRGGRELATIYSRIIELLNAYGEVVSEHVGDDLEIRTSEMTLTEKEIHDRDMEWIREADLVVAEVTVPSLGVGYEIGRAVEMFKPVLCLFKTGTRFTLSAMIAGVDEVRVIRYEEPEDLIPVLDAFVARHVEGLS